MILYATKDIGENGRHSPDQVTIWQSRPGCENGHYYSPAPNDPDIDVLTHLSPRAADVLFDITLKPGQFCRFAVSTDIYPPEPGNCS